ncbi:MAG: aminodeoxychorismate/anthranilate synthase component II [Sphingobacteriaceae bacterium]|nr:aminodeoxychorismate/anthranilate synthase component II [Sphingobacteriaceae bacterium]
MKKVLLIDNFDSFTFNLLHQIEQEGAACTVLRNNAAHWKEAAGEADAMVFSPGPCTPAEAGNMMEMIRVLHQKLPMLGICLGHQALGTFFGARLQRAPQPVHGKVSLIETANDTWVRMPGERYEVMRYHSLVLHELPNALMPLAWSEDGCIMAMRHVSLPLFGLQFHPESIGTPSGHLLIRSFLEQIP